MKTLTCTQLGGPCNAPMAAATSEEMMKIGMEHVTATHPELAEKIKTMPKEDLDKWLVDFNAKWAAAPENAA
jgi:predicted small metal-binding protein